MITEDFELPSNGDWLVLPLTSSQTLVSNTGGTEVFIRFGSASTSIGFPLKASEKVVVDETIYVKSSQFTGFTSKVAVTR